MSLLLKAEFSQTSQKRKLNLHRPWKLPRRNYSTKHPHTKTVRTSLAQTNAAQFLVDDALQILSSLSQTHGSPEISTSSIFLRFMWKTFDILKSLSFLQYSSQEEPLSYHDTTQEHYENALQLLTKAGETGNSDAMYLLGELNFVNP
jgi:hypothetical protein